MATLKNAPLQEVIFEVRWELDVNPENNLVEDSRIDLALGTFANSISNIYPIQNKRPQQVLIQDSPIPYGLTHWFRKEQDEWPLVQIGPGIMTVNDREGSYNWTDYFGQIKMILNKLNEAYDGSIRFIFSSLRYIDSVKIKDYTENVEWDRFVSENMNLRFENLFDTKGKLLDFNLNQIFGLPDDNQLLISVSSGKDAEGDRLIWQTTIFKQKPVELNDLIKWVDEVHEEHASPLLKKMLKPDFYDSFY